MKKLVLVMCVFVLFILLLGASNSVVSVEPEEKAVPGESFGASKALSTNSTDEVVEVIEPEIKIIPKLKERKNPLASGDSFLKGESFVGVKRRAYTEVLDSFDLGQTELTDCEWNGRYIYISQGYSESYSTDIIVFDPETGSIVDQWTLPFVGGAINSAFVNGSMYVADPSILGALLRKVNPTTHALIDSFPLPGGSDVRGITSDGERIYIGAGFRDSIYLADTLGNVIDSWYIGSFTDVASGLAYASRDTTLWLTDLSSDLVMKVDLSGATAVLLDSFLAPNQNTASGLAFDGSDLWFTAYGDTKLYRIDGGYSRSRIALFQDHEPWGLRSIKDILYENGIPFKVFTTSDIGSADLSIYTKAIIAGQQDNAMGVAIANDRAWWENWISDGGVLQISGATYFSESWEGLILPGNFTCSDTLAASDTLNIVSPWHPLVNEPHTMNGVDLSGWNKSTHGCFVGITGHYTVIDDTLSRPVLAIKRLGDGGIIATMQPLEFAWGMGFCPILENVVKYWQYGVSTNVLFAFADVDAPWLKNALTERDSLIGNIDYMDLRNYSPILEDLNMYDVVLARSNYRCLDSAAVGDTLAAYVDLGGRVIVASAAWYGSPYGIFGAIMGPAYNPFNTPSGGNHYSTANLGWYDAAHPMMDGVTTLSDYYRDFLQVNPGADTVAKYDDGEYLLGYKTQASDGLVVGFNLFVSDTLVYYWSGQMVKLLSNIIDWSAEYSGIEDVTEIGDGLTMLGVSSPIMTGNEWLTFSIDSPIKVELSIINIAGMVASTKSLNYTTPGVKKIDFDVSALPSGPYFLSVKTSEGSATRKALVIR